MLANVFPKLVPQHERLALACALTFAAGTVWLGMGPRMLGPSDWDDAMYCDRAAYGQMGWDTRNRYVHIWGLRLFDLLFDSRAVAAACYASVLFGLLCFGAFLAGRRLGGGACGLLAMLLTSVFPPLLKYLSVPQVDLPVTLFALLALLCAVRGVEAVSSRAGSAALVGSGLCCYLALKSKETGLMAVPVVLYVLADARGPRLRVYCKWLAGMALGFGLLRALDASFASDSSFWSSDLGNYFGASPVPAASGASVRPSNKFRHDILSELFAAPVLAFVLTGVAGLAHAFVRDRMAKALGLWFLGVTLFTSFVAWRWAGIDVEDRYLMPLGAALCPLAALWVTLLRRRGRGSGRSNLLWLVPLLLWLAHVGWLALPGTAFHTTTQSAQRAALFMLPTAMLVLFITPWLTPTRVVPVLAALALLGLSAMASLADAGDHLAAKRAALASWRELAQVVDHTGAPIALWQPRKLNRVRVQRRLSSATSVPIAKLALRNLDDPANAEPGELIFTGSARNAALEARGLTRLVAGDWPDPWSVYGAHASP
jgi:hypothetical protein